MNGEAKLEITVVLDRDDIKALYDMCFDKNMSYEDRVACIGNVSYTIYVIARNTLKKIAQKRVQEIIDKAR